jgi:hypothetical protein
MINLYNYALPSGGFFFYTNGHNPNPFLSFVNQLFAGGFSILF